MSSDRLVSIIRGDRGLRAVVSARASRGRDVRFTLETRGLDAVPAALRAGQHHVAASWSALAQARRPTLDALTHATIILLETVAEPGARCRIRTAFRPALPAAAGAVAARLVPLGYEPKRLAAALQSRDPYLAYHHAAAPDTGDAPPRFVRCLLPLLRGLPWDTVRQTVASFWASQMNADDDLCAAIARLLALAGPERALGWWKLLLRLPSEQRLCFAVALIESDAYATDPTRVRPSDMDRAAALASGDLRADRWALFADGLKRGRTVPFLLTLLRTARIYAPHCGVSRLNTFVHDAAAMRALPEDFEDVLHRVLAHVAEPMRLWWGSGFAIGLCRCSVVLPGLAEALRRPVFLEAAPRTSFALLRFLLRRFYYEEKPDLEAWAAIRRELPGLEQNLAAVPVSHQPKYVSLFEEVLFGESALEGGGARSDVVHAVVRRLARAPFGGNDCAADALAALIEAAGDNPARLLSAGDTSFRRLEDACGNDNRRRLFVPGLAALAAHFPGLVLQAFAQHPEALIKAAAVLGSASPPRRAGILRRFRSHPILHRGFSRRPIAEVGALLGRWSGPGRTNPVPRKLRLHLEAGLPLSAASIDGHRQTIARRLVLVKLDLLRDAVVRDLAVGLPPGLSEGDGGRHALVLLGSLGRHRRLLRRLLVAYGRGDRDFALRHAANRAWLARHPRVGLEAWTQGIEYASALGGGERVTLRLERDPLEALKLGTIAGSCLSVGGVCDYAAVAVVADVNKQVVYARRDDGTIVGRQVAALTEDDRVVFSPLYPIRAEEGLVEAFVEFDRRWTQRLGLAPVLATDGEYAIASIVAGESWDDGVWARLTPDVFAARSGPTVPAQRSASAANTALP